MAKLLLGKEVTDALNANLQTRTAALREKGIIPTLGIVRVGADPSDLSYEKGATKRAELVGVDVKKFELPADASKEDVLAVIDQVNADDSIHGVLMFRPLPKHLKADQNEICNRLDPKKDVDCMTHLSNAGVFEGLNGLGFAPCTPAACMEILDFYGNTNEVALTSLTPDASIKAGTFQFTPPQGITVENLMNQDAPERPLLQ